ncbi:MAG: hypothetical protein J2P57_05555 [Acidimicrobiaceae bacterium]|nr:hypothetical protein [Acidimicrobiaceae bacterium]
MAVPDDLCAAPRQSRGQPQCLWVVENYRIARSHQITQVGLLSAERTLIDGTLILAQMDCTLTITVQQVVQALGQLKEVSLSINDEPAGTNASSGQIAENRAE